MKRPDRAAIAIALIVLFITHGPTDRPRPPGRRTCKGVEARRLVKPKTLFPGRFLKRCCRFVTVKTGAFLLWYAKFRVLYKHLSRVVRRY